MRPRLARLVALPDSGFLPRGARCLLHTIALAARARCGVAISCWLLDRSRPPRYGPRVRWARACRAKVLGPSIPTWRGLGHPLPDGVVLWTRLSPKPLEGGGMPQEAVQVDWQVADDEQMTKVVKKGTTVANPDWAHSVHVEVQGLRPDRWYFYQFQAGGETSPVGRTRTMPAGLRPRPSGCGLRSPRASISKRATTPPTSTCPREHPDLVIHLGDYIYEGAGRDDKVRRHAGAQAHHGRRLSSSARAVQNAIRRCKPCTPPPRGW